MATKFFWKMLIGTNLFFGILACSKAINPSGVMILYDPIRIIIIECLIVFWSRVSVFFKNLVDECEKDI